MFDYIPEEKEDSNETGTNDFLLRSNDYWIYQYLWTYFKLMIRTLKKKKRERCQDGILGIATNAEEIQRMF